MTITTFLEQLAQGLAQWLPTLAMTLVDCFENLFFVTGESGVTGLNTLGAISVSFFIIGLGFRVLPAVLGWLRAKWTARKGRRSRRRA